MGGILQTAVIQILHQGTARQNKEGVAALSWGQDTENYQKRCFGGRRENNSYDR